LDSKVYAGLRRWNVIDRGINPSREYFGNQDTGLACRNGSGGGHQGDGLDEIQNKKNGQRGE